MAVVVAVVVVVVVVLMVDVAAMSKQMYCYEIMT